MLRYLSTVVEDRDFFHSIPASERVSPLDIDGSDSSSRAFANHRLIAGGRYSLRGAQHRAYACESVPGREVLSLDCADCGPSRSSI